MAAEVVPGRVPARPRGGDSGLCSRGARGSLRGCFVAHPFLAAPVGQRLVDRVSASTGAANKRAIGSRIGARACTRRGRVSRRALDSLDASRVTRYAPRASESASSRTSQESLDVRARIAFGLRPLPQCTDSPTSDPPRGAARRRRPTRPRAKLRWHPRSGEKIDPFLPDARIAFREVRSRT